MFYVQIVRVSMQMLDILQALLYHYLVRYQHEYELRLGSITCYSLCEAESFKRHIFQF